MKLTEIKIHNILAIQSLEVKAGGRMTVLEGQNSTGKTSILAGIRAALGAGHDATLLRKGAKQGEIVLVFEDGTEVTKRITEAKSDTKVRTTAAGTVSAAQRFIGSLLDGFGLNPVEFISADSKRRASLLLEAMPLSLTKEQLNACIPSQFMVGGDVTGHPLVVIAKLAKEIYDERTGVNRVAKEAAIAAERAEQALPAEPEGGDWDARLRDAEGRLAEWETALRKAESAIDGDAAALAEREQAEHRERYTARQRETDERCREINEQIAELQRELAATKARCAADLTAMKSDWADRHRALAASAAREQERLREQELPVRDGIKQDIADIKAKRDAHLRAQSLRDLAAERREEARINEAESHVLTDSLSKLEALKRSLAESLPIQGVEVRDGEVFVHDDKIGDWVPFDRANDARQIRIAIDVAKARASASKVPIILVDRMEALNPARFKLFEEEITKAEQDGFQFVLARATDDVELKVRAE